MTSDAQHLSDRAKGFLDRPDADRIEEIRREKWIDYPAAREILDDFNDLIHYPVRSRMPCRLLIADSNNGKTSLLRKFLSAHPSDPNLDGDHVKIPVLFTILSSPEEKELYRKLLGCLFQEYTLRATNSDLKAHLISVLLRTKPKMILLDEVNTIFSGTARKSRDCLNGIKDISNQTGIPIVGAGTREALSGFRSDEQMENRFEPRRLTDWKPSPAFRSLLLGFERVTPLKLPSNLADKSLAGDILQRSGGKIGEVATLIATAATYSIHKKIECITPEVLDACGFKSPATRRGIS